MYLLHFQNEYRNVSTASFVILSRINAVAKAVTVWK